jgi:ubiquinone/menaquinone biosynthesis C-methylase UbiE
MRITEKEVRETYDRIAKKYHKGRQIDKKMIYNEYNEVPATLSLLQNIRGKKILDLGCGTGIYTKILKKKGAKVQGIDISPKMIEFAKQYVKGVDFKVGSAYKLPYKSGTFDIVLASLVVHYFGNLDKAFKEIRRVLKKNGVFIFSSDNPLVSVTHRIKGKPRKFRVFGDYFNEGKFYERWPKLGIRLAYQHFTFQTMIRTIVRNGFVLEDFIDTKTVKAAEKIDRSMYAFTSKVPWFSVWKVRKV